MAGSLFEKAKDSAPEKKSSSKDKKVRILVETPDFHQKIKRQSFLKDEIKSLTTESELLDEEIKEVGKEEWSKLYEKNGVNPESIMIETKEGLDTAQFMLLIQDKYITIDEARAIELKEKFGEGIVTETDTYAFDKDMVEKYGDVISTLIMESTEIAEHDKENIIKATTKYSVTKGTVDKLKIYADSSDSTILDLVEMVRPVTATKNVEFIEGTAVH